MATNTLNTGINSILSRMWLEFCARGNTLHLKVLSGSMAPLICKGDMVKVRKIEPSRIKRGDVIAFIDDAGVVVHRVISVKRSGSQYSFRQVGDAGGFSHLVTGSDIVGKVFSIERHGQLISLDESWHKTNGLILAIRSRFREYLHHMRPAFLGFIIRRSLGLVWKLVRRVLFRCA